MTLRQSILIAVCTLGSGIILSAQESGKKEFHQTIGAGYSYTLSGAACFNTPPRIINGIEEFGYSDIVSSDLKLSAELWQHYVIGHTYYAEYELPSKFRDISFIIGGLFRRETAKRYAEIYYNPPYVFSGTEMTSSGGGLYTGLAYNPQYRSFGLLLSGSLAYFNFSREYLYYFYLDPASGGLPIERNIREKLFSSGIGGFFKLGISYTYKSFTLTPMLSILMNAEDNTNYGGWGSGLHLQFGW